MFNKIKIISPRPYEMVNTNFSISGWVLKDLVDKDKFKFDVGILDLYSGRILCGGGAIINNDRIYKKYIWFDCSIAGVFMLEDFLIKTNGRTVVQIIFNNEYIFLPIIIDRFYNAALYEDNKLKKIQSKTGRIFVKNEKRFKAHNKKLNKIYNKYSYNIYKGGDQTIEIQVDSINKKS